jgi:hypothetical protein
VNKAVCVVVGVMAAVVAGCGSSATKTVTVKAPAPVTVTNSTSTGSAGVTQIQSATIPIPLVRLSGFQSPSGNIGCIIVGGIARCDIKQRAWKPPPTPKSCPPVVNYGQGLEVSGAGPGRLVCAGDTALNPSARKLAYGTGSKVGPFVCVSETGGITCSDAATRHGFNISAQSYRVF